MAILTSASVPAAGLSSVRTKLMATLFVAQVCGSTGQSIVLAIGSILAASITGTNTWSGLPVAALLGIGSTASAFLVSVAGYALGALLIQVFLRPDPLTLARQAQEIVDAGAATVTTRSLGVILNDVRVQIALATLAVSQFVMISTTSTSPLYLHDQGHNVQTIGLAVSLHLAGMYVTSPLAGWLSDRFGRLLIIGAGAVILILAVILAGMAPGSDRLLVIL